MFSWVERPHCTFPRGPPCFLGSGARTAHSPRGRQPARWAWFTIPVSRRAGSHPGLQCAASLTTQRPQRAWRTRRRRCPPPGKRQEAKRPSGIQARRPSSCPIHQCREGDYGSTLGSDSRGQGILANLFGPKGVRGIGFVGQCPFGCDQASQRPPRGPLLVSNLSHANRQPIRPPIPPAYPGKRKRGKSTQEATASC